MLYWDGGDEMTKGKQLEDLFLSFVIFIIALLASFYFLKNYGAGTIAAWFSGITFALIILVIFRFGVGLKLLKVLK